MHEVSYLKERDNVLIVMCLRCRKRMVLSGFLWLGKGMKKRKAHVYRCTECGGRKVGG